MWKLTNYYFSLSRNDKEKNIRVQGYVSPALFLHHLYLLAAGCSYVTDCDRGCTFSHSSIQYPRTLYVYVNTIYLPISTNKISKTVLCRSLLISVLIIQYCQLNNLYWIKKMKHKEDVDMNHQISKKNYT